MDVLQVHDEGSGLISKAAFEELFLTYSESLCNAAYRLVPDRHVAEDIVQDFFFSFWKNHRDKQFQQSFLHYAQRAVQNRALDYLRYHSIRQTQDWDSAKTEMAEETEEEKQMRVTQEQLYMRLEQELARLPENRRKIFLMSNQQGMKYQQIADVLNISINTVKTQVRLAYQQLRDNCLLLVFILLIKIVQVLHPFFCHIRL
ncbi:MAG: RNA polymerase sigma-70 factor [Filimonas sp.]|nr:RNA polymerase sigma-70 factor [Filimonas sp.]